MKTELLGWAPHEWEVARAFYCAVTVTDWSDSFVVQAAVVKGYWLAQHGKRPNDDYILNRLRYETRPADFQWVAAAFSEALSSTALFNV